MLVYESRNRTRLMMTISFILGSLLKDMKVLPVEPGTGLKQRPKPGSFLSLPNPARQNPSDSAEYKT